MTYHGRSNGVLDAGKERRRMYGRSGETGRRGVESVEESVVVDVKGVIRVHSRLLNEGGIN